jgi:hypothetical protein
MRGPKIDVKIAFASILRLFHVKERYTKSGHITFTTHFYDEIIQPDGSVEMTEGHNLITDGMRQLLAALFAGQSGYTGVQYWAVGSGPANGDLINPLAPLSTDNRLATETARVPVTISFVDDLGSPTSGLGLSKHVQVQATFGAGISTGTNVEFGLFGGNASASVNGGGLLLNRVTHPMKYKNSGDIRRLTIIIDF